MKQVPTLAGHSLCMKEFWSQHYNGNSIGEWIISIAIVLVTLAFARIVYILFYRLLKPFFKSTKTSLDETILAELDSPLIFAIILAGLSIAFYRLDFPLKVQKIASILVTFLVVLIITWAVIRLTDIFLKRSLVRFAKRSDKKLNNELIPLLRKTTRLVLWTIGLIVALHNTGIDVAALIAGLGIGGLAVALAAQDTIKNIFGGIMIFIDKPFRISERIRIDQLDGFVEEIGIRSTRIRTLQGRVVTVPNAQFSDRPIENISEEPDSQIKLVLGLSLINSPEKIQYAEQLLKDIAAQTPGIVSEKTVIYFSGFSENKLSVTLFYYIKRDADFFGVQQEVNHRIHEKFRQGEIDFARIPVVLENR